MEGGQQRGSREELQRACKAEKKEISLTVDLIIRKPGRAIFLWLDADWQGSRIVVLFPSCLWPISSARHLAGSSGPMSDAAGSGENGAALGV